MERDVLSIEIDRELNRAHKFVNALMADKKAQKRFFQNPSQVMIDLGLFRPKTKYSTGVANKIFYLTLSNKKLIRYCLDEMPEFRIPDEFTRKTWVMLNRGQVAVDPRLDEIITEAYLSNEKHLEKMFLISLRDLNKRGVFSKRYTDRQVRDYVTYLLLEIKSRRSSRNRARLGNGPVCEPSDVDVISGPVCFPSDAITDVDAISTSDAESHSNVLAFANAGVAATTEIFALATVFALAFVAGFPARRPIETDYPPNFPNSTALATLSKLTAFASELMLHVENLDSLEYEGKV